MWLDAPPGLHRSIFRNAPLWRRTTGNYALTTLAPDGLRTTTSRPPGSKKGFPAVKRDPRQSSTVSLYHRLSLPAATCSCASASPLISDIVLRRNGGDTADAFESIAGGRAKIKEERRLGEGGGNRKCLLNRIAVCLICSKIRIRVGVRNFICASRAS